MRDNRHRRGTEGRDDRTLGGSGASRSRVLDEAIFHRTLSIPSRREGASWSVVLGIAADAPGALATRRAALVAVPDSHVRRENKAISRPRAPGAARLKYTKVDAPGRSAGGVAWTASLALRGGRVPALARQARPDPGAAAASNAHPGLKAALAQLLGCAWQRCSAHSLAIVSATARKDQHVHAIWLSRAVCLALTCAQLRSNDVRIRSDLSGIVVRA